MFTVEKAPEKMTFYSEHKYYVVKKDKKNINQENESFTNKVT